jgi:hypothetical protein
MHVTAVRDVEAQGAGQAGLPEEGMDPAVSNMVFANFKKRKPSCMK